MTTKRLPVFMLQRAMPAFADLEGTDTPFIVHLMMLLTGGPVAVQNTLASGRPYL